MYRIVDVGSEAKTERRSIAEFDSAYEAADALRGALLRGEEKAVNWRVLGPDGSVLVQPGDFPEMALDS